MSSPVSRVLSGTVIHLGPASPQASSDLPESSAGRAIGFLFGLAPGGVYHRRELLPVTRCALTAPFHPYRCPRTCHGHLGGILSVALSVGSRRPGVTWHLALWSPDFPPPVKPAATVWRARARPYSSLQRQARKTANQRLPEIRPSETTLADTAHSWRFRLTPRPASPLFSPATLSAATPTPGPPLPPPPTTPLR